MKSTRYSDRRSDSYTSIIPALNLQDFKNTSKDLSKKSGESKINQSGKDKDLVFIIICACLTILALFLLDI